MGQVRGSSDQRPGSPPNELAALYTEGYFLRGEGSNYEDYGDDDGWNPTLDAIEDFYGMADMLEVGCATGWFGYWAVFRGWDWFGIDISEWAMAHALMVDRVNRWDIEDGLGQYHDDAFQFVVSWEMLEHIHEEKVPFVIEEMTRVGVIQVHRIGMLLKGEDPASLEDDDTHVTIKPREWWEERFADAGVTRDPKLERHLDKKFTHRDWEGRFICTL